MSEALRQIQVGAWLACIFLALVVAAGCLFPSLRNPNWTGEEWRAGIILALLAIALRD